MINFRFEIANPFGKDRFKNLGSLSGTFTKYKSWELQHTFYDNMLFDVDFNIKRRCDHSGLYLVIGFLTYAVHFAIYDIRHWDIDTDTWAKYD